jgi:hypothetical protein
LHSRIWCAISHQPAFNGVLSAFHRSNHCHAAERMKSSPLLLYHSHRGCLTRPV